MRDCLSLRTLPRARAMRHAPTEAERKLWYALRDRRMQSVKFRRQAPVGPYIDDFLCVEHRLRDAWLARDGYKVLRFGNRDIQTAHEEVGASPHPALRATFSRKREKGLLGAVRPGDRPPLGISSAFPYGINTGPSISAFGPKTVLRLGQWTSPNFAQGLIQE